MRPDRDEHVAKMKAADEEITEVRRRQEAALKRISAVDKKFKAYGPPVVQR